MLIQSFMKKFTKISYDNTTDEDKFLLNLKKENYENGSEGK